MQLFAKINGAKKEKEDLVDEKGVGSSNEPGPTEQLGTGGGDLSPLTVWHIHSMHTLELVQPFFTSFEF